jgi:hypothetical protein
VMRRFLMKGIDGENAAKDSGKDNEGEEVL